MSMSDFQKLMLMLPLSVEVIQAVTELHLQLAISLFAITRHIPTPWQPDPGEPRITSAFILF